MRPLFSIIIPVYNVGEYLRKCLDSVIGQTCPDWECICVDDGSTDGGEKILDEYVSDKLRVIHQKNAGVSVARNVALDCATGEWVQFLDADDSLELDFLERLKQKIVEYPNADTIEHTAVFCYDDGSREYRRPPACVITGADVLNDPYGIKYTSLARCSCYKIFRRSLIEENHLRFAAGIVLSEDVLFATMYYAFAEQVVVAAEIAGYLRIFREGSAMLTVNSDKLIGKISVVRMLFDFYQNHPTSSLARKLTAEILALFSLGKGNSFAVRERCISELQNSFFFSVSAMRFLFKFGTWKARLLAVVYRFLPGFGKRLLLKSL